MQHTHYCCSNITAETSNITEKHQKGRFTGERVLLLSLFEYIRLIVRVKVACFYVGMLYF